MVLGSAAQLIGFALLFGRAWWNLRSKGSSAGESTWHDVSRVRELIKEMIADDAVGWGAGIVLVGLALTTAGSLMHLG